MSQDEENPRGQAGAPNDDNSPSANGSGDYDDTQVVNVPFGELSLEEEFRRRQLLDAAAGYAQMGWRVHPLCWPREDGRPGCGYSSHNRRQEVCPSPGKRALLDDWPNRATSDAVRASQWWRKVEVNSFDNEEWFPFASIGIVLGQGSDIFALDVDPDHDGFEELARQERENGALPATRVHETGSGGNHYLFQWPGFRVYNLKPWGADAGLDIKGDNGYIVVPPSRSHKGDYNVTDVMARMPVAPAPEWILEKLRRERAEQHGEQVITADALPNRLIARYVEGAMKGESLKLGDCPRGARNDMLNASAFSLGTLGAHGFLSESEALALLTEAGRKNGMIREDGQKTFTDSFYSGWNSGLRNPRDLSGVGNLAEQGWPRLPKTEFALGDRLVIYFGDRLRWVDDWDAWMSYTSGIWERRRMTEAERYAERMIRLLATTEAPLYSDEPEPAGSVELSGGGGRMLTDDTPRQAFTKWLEKQKTHSKKVNVAKIARDSPLIRAVPHQFDARSSLLNVANGVIDLTTGKLQDHNPDLMLTIRSPIAFNASHECQGWLRFLAEVQPDPEMRLYLQRVVGYSATGEISEQVFFLHHGSGANGKSVFHEVISRILGAYSQTVPVDTLMDSTMDRVPNDIARMIGRRYLIASETKAGKSLDEPKLKQLTGGDTVSARFMRGEFFEFRPTGKIHLTTNHLPRLTDDSATWRRIRMIPWPVQIPEGRRDGYLAERLFQEEGPGILNWIIQGALHWRFGYQDQEAVLAAETDPSVTTSTASLLNAESLVNEALRDTDRDMRPYIKVYGLRPPVLAELVKEEYKLTEDELQLWLDERVDIDLERTIVTHGSTSKNLWNDYKAWCQDNGYSHKLQRAFTHALQKKDYHFGKTGSHRGFAQLTPKMGLPPR